MDARGCHCGGDGTELGGEAMVYELTLTSVKLKIEIFNPPAKLINNKELTCAAGIAYKRAGLPMPQPEVGENIDEFRRRCLSECGEMEDNLKYVLEGYTAPPDEVVTEDALITLKLGYEV